MPRFKYATTHTAETLSRYSQPTVYLQSISYIKIWRAKVKPGFYYPSWRPELTARVDGWPVSITRQRGPCWRARVSTIAELTGRMVLCKCLKNYTYFTLACKGLGLVRLALYLVDWPTVCCPSVLDTVDWVTWPVKIVPDMTYNVFGGTLNPTLLAA